MPTVVNSACCNCGLLIGSIAHHNTVCPLRAACEECDTAEGEWCDSEEDD